MLCFQIVMFVYAITLIKMTFQSSNDNILSFHIYLCHVSGALACELLLLILVTPLWWVVINVSSAILVVALCFRYQHAPVAFNLVGTHFGIMAETSSTTTTNGEEQPDVEMVTAQSTEDEPDIMMAAQSTA